MSFNSRDPCLYDYVKITFVHPVSNAQWRAKFGLLFLNTPCTYILYIGCIENNKHLNGYQVHGVFQIKIINNYDL
jgi:hypothetical protein